MASLGAGTVSGYQSHGPERRADAGSPTPARLGGTPMIRRPFTGARPLAGGSNLNQGAEMNRFRQAGRFVQAAQVLTRKTPAPASGTTWTATASPVPGPSGGTSPAGPGALPPGPGMPYNQGWVPHSQQPGPAPAYGGAAWNGGGGALANAISGTSPPVIQGQIEPPDGS